MSGKSKKSRSTDKKYSSKKSDNNGRHEFWAHETLEYTDDHFEDDFAEDITRPLKS